MANPISIAASVITLAATAAQISKALSKLRAFGELPQQVYVPKNEVTDLEVVLRQIGHRLQQQSWTPDIGQESLKQTLARAKVQLAGLANGLERIANACAGGKVKTISRCAVWFKEKVSFQYFQSELHPIKTTLNLMLSASNSWVKLRHHIEMPCADPEQARSSAYRARASSGDSVDTGCGDSIAWEGQLSWLRRN